MPKNFTAAKSYYLLLILTMSVNLMKAQVPLLDFHPTNINLTSVVDIVNAGDGTNRIFIVLQTGTIKVYDQSFNYIGDYLTVSDVNTTGNERGLLSLAFHPQYAANGYLYVYYTGGPNGDITLARYSKSINNPNQADPDSKVVLMAIPKPLVFTPPFIADDGHNGGKLNFGPDGYLYFATGDGAGEGGPDDNAQNGNSLFGKMIRIDVNNEDSPYYSIPADNPYIHDPDIRDEVWATGL